MKIIVLICAFVIFSIIVSILGSIAPQKSYGDGFTQENLPPANVGNRKVSLFVKINPPIITSENNQDRYLQFRWFDANTNQTIQHTSFLVAITKHNELLMQGIFHTHTGNLTLKITPSNDPKKWAISGIKEPILDGFMYLPPKNGTIDVLAPILGEGGLYHIYLILLTLDNDQNFLIPQDAPKFDSYLSVGDISNHTITYRKNSYNSEIISYYDKIRNYSFDQSKLQESWSIPFDWNITRFQNLPIFIHEEVHVPKSFKEFTNTPTYIASVNGNPITGRRLVIDPYSLGDTMIAHILLNKIDIENFAKTIPNGINSMDFQLAPVHADVKTSSSVLTDFGGWGVMLGWSPIQITANTLDNLKLTFFDAFSEQQVKGDVKYDLKILDKDENPVFSETSLTAKGGIDTKSINLPNNGIYRIEISIKSIVNNDLPDTSRLGIARGDLVIPSTVIGEETVPEFGSLTRMIILISIVGVVIISRRLGFHY